MLVGQTASPQYSRRNDIYRVINAVRYLPSYVELRLVSDLGWRLGKR